MKIAITTTSFARYSRNPLDLLDQAGIAYTLNPYGRKITENEAADLLHDCVGVVAGTEPVTAKVMKAAPGLKVISRCGTGMDNVDLEAAENRNIAVRNTPDGPTAAVAELTLGYALDLLRRISRMDRELRRGIWKKQMGFSLEGKTLGIVGLGRIGLAVADMFTALGVEVVFTDPVAESDKYEKMSMNDLLPKVDILSFHCSKTNGDSPVFSTQQLNLMKQGSWIINAARGGIVDEKALYESLKSGHTAGAALDVFDKEPYEGPLTGLDNVILTPHIGSYARESRIRMESDAVHNLLDVLNE